MSDVVDRFATLNLHDGQLLRVVVQRDSTGYSALLDIDMVSDEAAHGWTPCRLLIHGCSRVEVDADLEAMLFANGAIDDSRAALSPVPATDIGRPRHTAPRVAFCIEMCPPGGKFEIVGGDFSFGPRDG